MLFLIICIIIINKYDKGIFMKKDKLFFIIYTSFLMLCIFTLITLSILGSKSRTGYLGDFKFDESNIIRTLELNGLNHVKENYIIDGKLDEESIKNFIFTNESITQYSYGFRVKYYDKVFRNSDIYGVYVNTDQILKDNNFINTIIMNGNGSPFGNVVSTKIIDFDKIDNINYILKVKKSPIILLLIIFILLFFLYYIKNNKEKSIIIINNINKYRFAIAGIIFILCIIFEINGSSIDIYSNLLNTESGIIFGNPRAIRSDEWKVLTPFMLSQYENHTGKFPYFSDLIRGNKTDMYMLAQSPVMDIAILFRLFQIGFLFLPPAKGLSFFWMGRIIALFLVSFEIMKLITNKNNQLSLFGALLITFAPTINWWFSTNIVEIVIFTFLSAIFLYLYFKEKKFVYRILYIGLIFISWGNLLFTLYPAWQVPFGYLLLSLYIWTIIENWKTFNIKTKKKDFIVWAIFFMIFIFLVCRIFIKSKETIDIVRNTVYPGTRFETGGGIFLELFRWAINLFTPYNEHNIISNTCELSVFIDFFPIPYIFAAYLIFKQKVKDKLLIILSIYSLFIFIYMTIGFPNFLSKISLLYNSQSLRIIQIFGMINIFVLIRSLHLYKPNIKIIQAIILSSLLALFIVFFSYQYQEKYLNMFMMTILFISLFIIFLSLLQYKNDKLKKIFLTTSSLFVIISSIYINPIRYGLDVIYDSNLYKSIKEISSKDNEGLWITCFAAPSSISIISGAPTINSVNAYPNLERWKILDADSKYNDIYNRYAHITVNIISNTNRINKFELLSADHFQLNLTLEDLIKINTKYILSDINLKNFNMENIKLIKQVDNFFIYSIVEKVNNK